MSKCEDCNDTGWYGDNGPGIKGNKEYGKCECPVGASPKSDEYKKQVWREHENQLAAKDAEIRRLRQCIHQALDKMGDAPLSAMAHLEEALSN